MYLFWWPCGFFGLSVGFLCVCVFSFFGWVGVFFVCCFVYI